MQQDFIWRRPKVNISEELRQKLVQKFARLSFDERQTREQQLKNFQITQSLKKSPLSMSNSPKANAAPTVMPRQVNKDPMYSPKVTTRNNNWGGQTQYVTDVRIGMVDDRSNNDSPVLVHDQMNNEPDEKNKRINLSNKFNESDLPCVSLQYGVRNRPKVSSPFKADSPSLRWMADKFEYKTMAFHEERIRDLQTRYSNIQSNLAKTNTKNIESPLGQRPCITSFAA